MFFMSPLSTQFRTVGSVRLPFYSEFTKTPSPAITVHESAEVPNYTLSFLLYTGKTKYLKLILLSYNFEYYTSF